MRVLAWFSFSFAVGAAAAILNLPTAAGFVLLGLAAAAGIAAAFLRGRKEILLAVVLAGLALGFLRANGYRTHVLLPAEQCTGRDRELSVTLDSYPVPSTEGFTATGIVEAGNVRFRAAVYLREDDGYLPGDRLSAFGNLEINGSDELGSYGRSVGLPVYAYLHSVRQTERAGTLSPRYYPAALLHFLQTAVNRLFPEDVRGYFSALLTGDKSGMTFGQKTDLKIAGVYHAFAVSGMHVSILMTTLTLIALRRQRIFAFLGIPVLVFYCLMLGGTASVVRAAVMQIFILSATLLHRESDTPTALGASLLLLTAVNPWSLTNAGLQLSFLATLGILLFSGRIYGFLTKHPWKHARPVQNAIAGICSQTCGALILTLPLTAVLFGTVPVFSILTNFLTVWAITAAFALSLFACAVYAALPAVAAVIAAPAVLLMRYADLVTHLIARIPFASLGTDSPYPTLWMLFLYGLVICLLLRRHPGRAAIRTACGWAVITLCLCLLMTWTDGRRDFTFTVLDVGQGQSLLFESQGQTAAVDCGGSNGDEAGELLAEQLRLSGRKRLDHLILTHYDRDHTGGVSRLLDSVEIGILWMPDIESEIRTEIEALAAQTGTELRLIRSDRELAFGTGSLKLFAPRSEKGDNESCIAVLASFGTYDIFVTGDLPTEQENALVEEGLPDLEILVAGHHGSSTSTGSVLLERTRPEIVVISVGRNAYGHPSEETLSRIFAVGAGVCRTDRNGTMTFGR